MKPEKIKDYAMSLWGDLLNVGLVGDGSEAHNRNVVGLIAERMQRVLDAAQEPNPVPVPEFTRMGVRGFTPTEVMDTYEFKLIPGQVHFYADMHHTTIRVFNPARKRWAEANLIEVIEVPATPEPERFEPGQIVMRMTNFGDEIVQLGAYLPETNAWCVFDILGMPSKAAVETISRATPEQLQRWVEAVAARAR